MKHSYLGTLLAGLLFTGCGVMHFKNGEVAADGPVMEKWHHNGILSLVEFSGPVSMKALCAEKAWSEITTKDTFLTILAGAADDVVISAVLGGGIDVWDPQSVTWFCGAGAGGAATPAPADSTK